MQKEGQKDNPVKDMKAEKKSEEAKGSKRQKTIQCKVIMLDDSQFECELDVRRFFHDSMPVFRVQSRLMDIIIIIIIFFSRSVLNSETCQRSRTSDEGV